jgi:hypothetical protein
MTLPRWDDPGLRAGTMVRSALWLVSEIGLGNSFTEEEHRAAFPGVAQAGRRLRDLRDHGWVIHTSAEDLTLNPDERRFFAIGNPVWERGARRNRAAKPLTAKMRSRAIAESDYQCVICGIAGGERYADAPHKTAVLAVSRRVVTDSDGKVHTMFVSECQHCRSGTNIGSVDIRAILAKIDNLQSADRAVFLQWAERGNRSALDHVWSDFRRLPEAARDEIRKLLLS